jgi:hypothetical protein
LGPRVRNKKKKIERNRFSKLYIIKGIIYVSYRGSFRNKITSLVAILVITKYNIIILYGISKYTNSIYLSQTRDDMEHSTVVIISEKS